MDLDGRGLHLGALRRAALPGRVRRLGGRALHLARELVVDGRAHGHHRVGVDVHAGDDDVCRHDDLRGDDDSASGGGNAAAGKAVFAANGCSSCHTFKPANATGTIGPDLDKAPAADAKADNNMNLAAFIKQSIDDPDAYIAKGYTQGDHADDVRQSLTPTQLNDLVAFILSGTAKS